MAENVVITAGSGTTIAADDIAGTKYQQVKLVASAADSTEALTKAEDSGHSSGEHGIMGLTVRQDTAAALGGTDADYQPLITDANGRLHVLDQNSGAILTALQIIDDWDDGDYCNVNINIAGTDAAAGEGVISAQTQRVTIATDDDGVAHLATIAGDTTAIETAIEIMDDWDATHASAAPADGACIMGAGYSTALPTDVGADADAARLVTDRYGRLCTGLQPQAAKATLDNADTTTARAIVAAVASRKIYITAFILSVDTAGNYWLEDGDATAVTGKFYLAANGGVSFTCPEGTPLNTVTVNKALNVKGSTAGNVSVTITYYLAP